MKTRATLVFALVALFSPVTALAQEPAEAEKPGPREEGPCNVILVSWDGLSRVMLWELLARQKLPALAGIIREGSLQDIDVKGHPTVTKPGHAEMLTGLGVEDTGVQSNGIYRPIPAGLSIFERVQDRLGGREAVRTFMVASKLAHVGGRGPREARAADAQRAKKKGRKAVPKGADDDPEEELCGEPYFLTRNRLDVFDGAQREADETGPLCLDYLEKFKDPRFLAFLHFSDPDHAGHRRGRDSAEYREAAIRCDLWLGKIVEWLKAEELYATTLIYVMTDHGFDEHGKSHSKAPDSWLATNDREVVCGGLIADVPATILARFGVDLEKLEPALIGKPLFAAPAAVEAADPKAGAKGKVRQALLKSGAKALIERLDQDGDGELAQEEFPQNLKRFLGKADADHDGIVTLEELDAMLRDLGDARKTGGEKGGAPAGGDAEDRVAARFRQADADGDGRITIEEAPERLQSSFLAIDTDGDGAITLEEFRAFVKSKAGKGRK